MGTKTKSLVRRFVRTTMFDGSYASYQINLVFYETRSGSVSPMYKNIISQGGDATNTLTASRMSAEMRYGSLVGKVSPNSDYILRDIGVSNPWYYPSFDTRPYISASLADNEAIVRIHAAVRNAQYAISGPTFAGEFRDTLRLLKKPAEGVRDLLTDFVKRNRHLSGRRLTASARKNLSKQWLEVQFGLKPLLSDTKAAADAVARLVTDVRRSRVSSIGRHIQPDPPVPYIFSPYGFFTVQGMVDVQRSCRVTYKVGIKAEVSGQTGYLAKLDRIRQVCGFNLSEFVPTAWELIPWSFAIDYFVNVGDILTCATTDQSGIVYIAKSIYYENRVNATGIQKRRYELHPENGKVAVDIPEQSAGGYTSLFTNVSRSRPNSLGIPSLVYKFPGVGQVTNLAALWGARR